MNGKYEFETAKCVCDFIDIFEVIINIETIGEYRDVMRKVMKAIKEAHNVQKKRRETTCREKSYETR